MRIPWKHEIEENSQTEVDIIEASILLNIAIRFD